MTLFTNKNKRHVWHNLLVSAHFPLYMTFFLSITSSYFDLFLLLVISFPLKQKNKKQETSIKRNHNVYSQFVFCFLLYEHIKHEL